MTNRLKSSQLKYLSIGYFRKYIKLPVLLFTFLIINPNKDGLFEGDFFRGGGGGGGGQFDPSFIFQEALI